MFIDLLVVKSLYIIAKPGITACQKTDKCGFTGSLTAYQTEHVFKLNPRVINTAYSPKKKNLHNLIYILVNLCSKKMMQCIADSFFSVP